MDGQRFRSTRLHGNLPELHDRLGVSRATAVGTWTKRLRHWGKGVAAECAKSSSKTGMPYMRCFEETVYERRLGELIASVVVEIAHPVMPDDGVPGNPAKEFVRLRWPFDDLGYCCAHGY